MVDAASECITLFPVRSQDEIDEPSQSRSRLQTQGRRRIGASRDTKRAQYVKGALGIGEIPL